MNIIVVEYDSKFEKQDINSHGGSKDTFVEK